MNRQERRLVGRIQTLVGRAKAGYMNDRAADRYGKVVPPLDDAFDLCVKLLGRYPPEDADKLQDGRG